MASISIRSKIRRRTAETRDCIIWTAPKAEEGEVQQKDVVVKVGYPSQEVRSEVSRALKWRMPKDADGEDATAQIESDIDSKKIFAAEVIRDIIGLTPTLMVTYLRVPMEPGDLKELQEQVDAQKDEAMRGYVPYNEGNAQDLYLYALDERFGSKIRKTVTEWDKEIRAEEDATRKK
jgi:hypothetical protein